MAKTIAISFGLQTDSKGLKQLIVDADGLKEALTGSFGEAQKLQKGLKSLAEESYFASLAQQATDAFNQLASIVNDLSAAYTAQIEVEKQLAINMRNTMNATDAQIQAIKDLCSAQQALGIIGDEVQLAGAQELATYLEQTEALEQLIPVMNDMCAQQYGYAATAENAAQIGAMLGKVMNGQVNALSRLGYKFDDAQKTILTYGNEMERVATLKDVINQSVGGENAALAEGAAGKAKQYANALGDIKEQAGKVAIALKPVVDIMQGANSTITGIARLSIAWYALSKTILSAGNTTKLFTAALRLTGSTASTAKAQMLAFSMATKTSEKAIIGLKIAIRSLMAATVIGALIAAVGFLIEKLMGLGDAADDMAGDFESAMDRVNKVREEGEAAMAAEESRLAAVQTLYQINIKRLKEFNGSKAEEAKIVKEMNDTYGETMGYFSSVSSWYKTLIANSEAYTRQMIVEAKQRALSNEITANEETKRGLKRERAVAVSNRDVVESYLFDLDNEIEALKGKTDNRSTADRGDKIALRDAIIRAINSPDAKNIDKDKERMSDDWLYEVGSQMHYGDTGSRKQTIPSEVGKAMYEYISSGQTVEELNAAINQAEANEQQIAADLEAYVKEAADIKLPVIGSPTRPDNVETDPNAKKSQIDLINEQIKAKQKEYMAVAGETPQADATRAEIAKTIDGLIKQKEALETLQKASERPFEIKTLADYDRELAYLQARRKNATAQELKDIDELIAKRQDERQAIELASKEPDPKAIKSYRDLNDAISYYTAKLELASAKERTNIQSQIDRLNKLKEQWERLAQVPPKALSKLSTKDEVDYATDYFSRRQGSADIEDYYANAKQLHAVANVKVRFDNADTIAEQINEALKIEQLDGKEYKIKLSAIGLDEVKARIAAIKEMLADTSNPMAEQQRKDAQRLLLIYGNWEKQLKKSSVNLKGAWGSVKGVGNAIKDMQSAITSSGSAWEKFTSIVDAGLNMFESINGIVTMIQSLTGATTVLTAEKTAENAIDRQKNATDMQQLGTVGNLIAANATLMGELSALMGITEANTAATQEEAAANLQDAGAKTFNAHAWMPWVGIGIAAAMVGVMIAQMASMPKFAEGGIVSGPTIGLMGEYPGASSNPEVIAPLSKLKSMIADANGSGLGGNVTFKIEGRDLVGVINKQNKYINRN